MRWLAIAKKKQTRKVVAATRTQPGAHIQKQHTHQHTHKHTNIFNHIITIQQQKYRSLYSLDA